MFRPSNPFDEVVANATSESLTSENWDLILTICEKVNRSGDNAGRDCLAAIQKRLNNKNANVVLYSLTLCESLAKNCGLKAQREISSRAFTALLVKILNEKTTHPAVRQRILELVQQWAFEFRADPSLGIMDETYQQLRTQSKFKFPSPQKPKKELKSEADKRKEEEELQLALALSLSASEHSERKSISKPAQHPEVAAAPVKRVRALYDFEPTESGELGFQKDDIITVLATSYQDWWKGELFGRQGIFPVNYVEEIKEGAESHSSSPDDEEAYVLQEAKNVDVLIRMLQNVDPRRDNFSDNDTLQDTYNNVLGIRPKLVELIKKHGEKKDEMMVLNEKLARARSTYERMMEQSIAKYNQSAYGAYQPQQPHTPGPASSYYTAGLPGQSIHTGQGNYSTTSYQSQSQQQLPGPGPGQVPQYQPDSQYTPYTPQQNQQLPPQHQQRQQSQQLFQQQQQQPAQQLTFDQAYPNQAPLQSQPSLDQNINGVQHQHPQGQPFSPLNIQQQQQQLMQTPQQGYQQQQPIASHEYQGLPEQQSFAPQQPGLTDNQGMYAPQPPAPFNQPVNGYAPQPQYAATAAPSFQ
ncbi:ESCRT-0 subunit protein hse1 [Mortierella claussenii]|nr:ESCRT-0 subunit protein hse1 [Mortierella claussenii]